MRAQRARLREAAAQLVEALKHITRVYNMPGIIPLILPNILLAILGLLCLGASPNPRPNTSRPRTPFGGYRCENGSSVSKVFLQKSLSRCQLCSESIALEATRGRGQGGSSFHGGVVGFAHGRSETLLEEGGLR